MHQPDGLWVSASHGSEHIARGTLQVLRIAGRGRKFIERIAIVDVVSAVFLGLKRDEGVPDLGEQRIGEIQ